jgi:hypothetical protein
MSCKIFWSQKDEKILLVKDSKGTIIASAEHLPGEDVSAGVVLDEGQKLEEICVPDDYEFDQVKRLQVVRDTKGTIVGDITKSCGWQEEKRWRILTGDET